MLLRSSISNTKKFFQKTIKNFKSFFSQGNYQRLPKASPHNPLSYSVPPPSSSAIDMKSNTSYEDREKLYGDFKAQWESEKEKAKRRIKKKAPPSPTKQENIIGEVYSSGRYINASPAQKKKKMEQKEKEHTHRRYCMVEKKLRELEMLDMNNVEHVLDIEEVLHYYSRLTCPAYLEIVDKFFMEMYSEMFGPVWHDATPHSVISRIKMRYH